MDAELFSGYFSDTVETQSLNIAEYVGGWDYRGSDASKLEVRHCLCSWPSGALSLPFFDLALSFHLQVDVMFNDTNQAQGRGGGGPPKLVRVNAPM